MIYSEYGCWLLLRQFLPPELTNRVYFWLLKDYRQFILERMHEILPHYYPRFMIRYEDTAFDALIHIHPFHNPKYERIITFHPTGIQICTWFNGTDRICALESANDEFLVYSLNDLDFIRGESDTASYASSEVDETGWFNDFIFWDPWFHE
jgi:hypothetical protein